MHDVTYHEPQAMFIDHVRQVVFVDKIITLQGLLHEYKRIMGTLLWPTKFKSSYVEEILVREFGCDIGFHVSQRKNLS